MNKSFTLIEILVVIVVIGILSAFVLVGMSSITSSANIAKVQAFINSMDNALLLGRVSQWKLDQVSGTNPATTPDTWNSNTGTLYDGVSTACSFSGTLACPQPVTSGCPSGNCLSFDGSNDYVTILGSNSSSSNLAITGVITISVWVRFNNFGTYAAIAGRGLPYYGSGNYGYFLWRHTDNKIYFDTHSTTNRCAIGTLSAITDTSWHFITVVWDGTTNVNGEKIYIDGALNNQGTSTISTMGQPNYEFRIGATSIGTSSINGSIDDVRIYNQAIPTSEIQQNYFVGLNNLYKNNGITLNEFNQRIGELKTNLVKNE